MNAFIQTFFEHEEIFIVFGVLAFIGGIAWSVRARSRRFIEMGVLNGENDALMSHIDDIQSENASLEFSLADMAEPLVTLVDPSEAQVSILGTPESAKPTSGPAPREEAQSVSELVFDQFFDRRGAMLDVKLGPRYTSEIAVRDDLLKIDGMTDQAAASLHAAGIFDYIQVALWNGDQINRIQAMLGPDVNIIEDRWQYQALRLNEFQAGANDSTRLIARHRIRRLLFKNDGGENPERPATVASFLEERMASIGELPVDAVFYSTTEWDSCAHLSVVCRPMGLNGDNIEKGWTEDLREHGFDVLSLVNEWAQEKHRECFFSLPMNPRCGHSDTLGSEWKEQHPMCLIGQAGERFPESERWDAVDYRHQPVRDHLFAVVNEVAENYEIDGIDLDFLGDAIFFRETALGLPVEEEQRRDLTDLIKKIRELANHVSWRRRHSMLLSVRIPGDMKECHRLGIDIERWIEMELVDLLVVDVEGEREVDAKLLALSRRHRIPVLRNLATHRVEDVNAAIHSMKDGEVSAVVVTNWYDPDKNFVDALVSASFS